jgi:hypothetical protein
LIDVTFPFVPPCGAPKKPNNARVQRARFRLTGTGAGHRDPYAKAPPEAIREFLNAR